MGSFDTTLGERESGFPETVWSSVLSDRDPSSPGRREALNRLFSRYWRPVYRFIRASWGTSVEDAKDLTQGFLCHILEYDFVAGYEPSQGRFRHFLKAALRNYAAEVRRDAARLKRGGGRTVLSLDVEGFEAEPVLPGRSPATPEELFDRQWKNDVLSSSVDELERVLKAEGRERVFRAYERYDLHPLDTAPPSYDDIARELGVPATQVAHFLHDARERLRKILLERVSEYVSTPRELEEEMREFFSA